MALKLRFSKGQAGNIRLDQLKVNIVEKPDEVERWNKLVEEHHYLHDARICGPQIRYVVECRGKAMALLSFSVASWHVAARENWISWNNHQRLSRLCFVAQNSRFLILPGVRTPNLASKSLSLCLRRLSGDWEAKYGWPLLLVETFVEKSYPGTSYRADNWKRLGETSGFSRGGPDYRKPNGAPKTMWGKELREGALELLRSSELPAELSRHERKLDCGDMAGLVGQATLESLFDFFRSAVPDPRRTAGRRHGLATCLSIIVCGILVGCEGLSQCANFAAALTPARKRALRVRYDRVRKKFITPCHTTLWRVMSMVDNMELEQMTAEWYNSPLTKPPRAFAIDGKTLRNSLDSDGDALHVVSAVSHDHTPFFYKLQRITRGGRARPPAISSPKCQT